MLIPAGETELLVAFLLNAIGMQQKLLWQELNIGAAACAGDGRYLDLLRAGTGVSLELGSTMCPCDTSDTPAQAPVSGGEGAKLGTQNQVRATRTAVGTLGSGAEPGGVTEQQAPLRWLRGPAALPGELTPSQTHRVKQAANRSLQLI